MTAIAAQAVNRPVKFAITRQMMVTNVGRRPETIQKVALATDKSGKLTAMRHATSSYKANSEYFEQCGLPAKVSYAAPIREITYEIAKLNVNAPTFMRAPGETPGSFALESAMDELAYELKMDPIELRVLNHSAKDPLKNLPFSLENWLECYRLGAEKFGWSKRKMQPRAIRNGRYLVGMGVAAATYPANRSKSSARIQMAASGDVKVFCATQDIGTGTYTIMAQYGCRCARRTGRTRNGRDRRFTASAFGNFWRVTDSRERNVGGNGDGGNFTQRFAAACS